jgi:hypothetical protein
MLQVFSLSGSLRTGEMSKIFTLISPKLMEWVAIIAALVVLVGQGPEASLQHPTHFFDASRQDRTGMRNTAVNVGKGDRR